VKGMLSRSDSGFATDGASYFGRCGRLAQFSFCAAVPAAAVGTFPFVPR
jgi:hypothetical protein